MPSWTIVTVSHNSAGDLALGWSAVAESSGVNWIVIDNNSTDDSVPLAESLGATVVPLGKNVGFGRACNRGLGLVTTPWVMFANPDIHFDPAVLERLETTATATGALVAPQLLNTDGSLQPNARGLPTVLAKFGHRLPLPPGQLHYARTDLDRPTWIAWAMGAAVAGRTDWFAELGGWDPRYFLYYEDHDLGLRAWQHRRRMVLEPRARLVHRWDRATGGLHPKAWIHELASAQRFYRANPHLLTERSALRHPGFAELLAHLWQPAVSWDLEPSEREA